MVCRVPDLLHTANIRAHGDLPFSSSAPPPKKKGHFRPKLEAWLKIHARFDSWLEWVGLIVILWYFRVYLERRNRKHRNG